MKKKLFFRAAPIVLVALVGLITFGCNRSTKEEEKIARTLADSVLTFCQEEEVKTRPVEAISAMAAVLGERCIVTAGEFKVREHTFLPGQRIFSDRINFLLSGDSPNSIPSDSVFGMLRARLAGSGYEAKFPDPSAIFQAFAAGVGKPEDWGKIPLSLPKEYCPRRLPLRMAFDSRSRVDEILKTVSADKNKSLRVCAIALSMVLLDVRDQVDHSAALKLALETINGMAKTAPMKGEAIDSPSDAMKEGQHQVIKIEHRKTLKGE